MANFNNLGCGQFQIEAMSVLHSLSPTCNFFFKIKAHRKFPGLGFLAAAVHQDVVKVVLHLGAMHDGIEESVLEQVL